MCLTSAAEMCRQLEFLTVFAGRLPRITKKVIADLLQCKSKSITIHYENVQKQNNGSDCGCFAIAFATSLCSGKEPSTEVYNQKEMRTHLVKSIDEQELATFPTLGKRKRSKTIIQKIPIYCVCRLPDDDIRNDPLQQLC